MTFIINFIYKPDLLINKDELEDFFQFATPGAYRPAMVSLLDSAVASGFMGFPETSWPFRFPRVIFKIF